MDEDTGIDLSKIVQHPFLVNHEPDIDEKTNVKVACSRIQQRLDEAYTAALDEIVGFCKGDGGRASLLIPALRAMCTFPEHASLSTENQQPFIKNLLNIMATIKQTPLEFGLYRSAVLSLLPPIIDWFTSFSNWADDSENFQHTAILVETLEIYAYEHGGRQDRRAFRTVELREHFALLLWRLRHPDWAESRQMGSLVGIPSVIAPAEADVLSATAYPARLAIRPLGSCSTGRLIFGQSSSCIVENRHIRPQKPDLSPFDQIDVMLCQISDWRVIPNTVSLLVSRLFLDNRFIVSRLLLLILTTRHLATPRCPSCQNLI
jgi:hypothetical protein